MRIIFSQTALVYLFGAVAAFIVATEVGGPALDMLDNTAAAYSAAVNR